MKANRVVLVGHKFMPTQNDVKLAVHVREDIHPTQKIADCQLITVECPIEIGEADLLTVMKEGEWSQALLGKYFKENILAGDQIK